MNLFMMYKIITLPIKPPYYLEAGMEIKVHLFKLKNKFDIINDYEVLKLSHHTCGSEIDRWANSYKDRNFFEMVKK